MHLSLKPLPDGFTRDGANASISARTDTAINVTLADTRIFSVILL